LGKRKNELKELVDLLRKLLRKGGYGSRRTYKSTSSYRPILRAPVLRNYENYRSLSRYPVSRSSYNPKPRYGLNPAKSTSYTVKPWNEPISYKPRERLVYDPEVKELLERIEKHLADSKKAEIREFEDISKLEFSGKVEKDEEFGKEELEKDESDVEFEGEVEVEEVDKEANEVLSHEFENVESSKLENVLDVSEMESESLGEVGVDELARSELVEDDVVDENFEFLPSESEVAQNFVESDMNVVERLESQDLSLLEIELFQPEVFQDLEVEVEDVEEGEAI